MSAPAKRSPAKRSKYYVSPPTVPDLAGHSCTRACVTVEFQEEVSAIRRLVTRDATQPPEIQSTCFESTVDLEFTGIQDACCPRRTRQCYENLVQVCRTSHQHEMAQSAQENGSLGVKDHSQAVRNVDESSRQNSSCVVWFGVVG